MTKKELIIFDLEDIKGHLADGEARCAEAKIRSLENPSFDVENVIELIYDGETRVVCEYIDEMITLLKNEV